MTTPFIIDCRGDEAVLPLSDPVFYAHYNNPAALVPRLIQQINEERIYDFAFKSANGWTMLDIGANIGLVSVYAAAACSRIIALEPSPQFEVLERVTRRFQNIQPDKRALGPRPGTTLFMLNDVNPTASSSAQTYGKPMMVNCINLFSLIQEYRLDRVDFCKVDIEGSETDCLTPYEVERCAGVVKVYFVEVHNCPNSMWEWKMGKLAETFAHAGYRKMRISGDSICASQT